MVSQIIADERWKLGRRRCLYDIAILLDVLSWAKENANDD
jgi:hypothetical protein